MAPVKRESNFELLRIICMLIIILSHYSVHGGFDTSLIDNPFNKLLIRSTGLGEVGVQCFFLISGYFMTKSCFQLKRVVQLELQLLFYSIVFGICTYLLFPELIDTGSLLRCFFPALTCQYWFMSVYLLLYLMLPFINFFMNHAPKRLLEYCILLLGIIYIFLPTLTSYTLAGESTITLFLTVYLLGGYIRLYPDSFRFFRNRKANLICALLCHLFIVFSVVFCSFVPVYPRDFFMRAQSLPLVLLSLSLFLAIKNTQLGYSRIINQAAASVLGIYLIHDNPYVRSVLWQKLLHNASYGNSPFLIVHLLVSIVLVFLVCMAIEKIRICLFERPLMNFLTPRLEQFQSFLIRRCP